MSEKLTLGKGIENIMGTSWWDIIQLGVLMARYQDSCIFLPVNVRPYTKKEYEHMINMGSLYTLTWTCLHKCRLMAPTHIQSSTIRYTDYLRKCIESSKRLSIIPIDLYSVKADYGHAGMLVYDKELNTLERFEPHGQHTDEAFYPHLLDRAIEKFFSVIIRKPFTYYPPQSFCPRRGPQVIEEIARRSLGIQLSQGTCSIWGFVYANYRLAHPNKTPTEIVTYLSTRAQKDLSETATLYHFIVRIIKMLAYVSQKIRKANSTDEMRKIFLKAADMFAKPKQENRIVETEHKGEKFQFQSKTERSFYCKICNTYFDTGSELKKHAYTHLTL